MSDLFDQYLSFHVPNPRGESERREYEHVEAIVREKDTELIKTLMAILGPTVQERLADLASNNSVTAKSPDEERRIPIIYVPESRQSHNLVLGVPYTGNYIGRIGDITTTVPHELAHTILGKFNDGITEAIATLFLSDRTHNPRTRFVDALLARGVLENFEEWRIVSSLRSISDLFRNRPMFRNTLALYHRGPAQQTGDPSTATHEFAAAMVRMNYGQELQRHRSLGLPVPLDSDVPLVPDFRDQVYRQTEPPFLLNPNETPGIARGLATRLGRFVMNFLLDREFDADSKQATPSQARESLRKLLVFYFQPFDPASLAQYGIESWEQLQSELLDAATARTQDELRDFGTAWFTFCEALSRHPGYSPATWSCQRQGPQNDPLDVLLDSRRDSGNGPGPGGPPPSIMHPVVEQALQGETCESIIDLGEYLGADRDYDQYFSLGEEPAD